MPVTITITNGDMTVSVTDHKMSCDSTRHHHQELFECALNGLGFHYNSQEETLANAEDQLTRIGELAEGHLINPEKALDTVDMVEQAFERLVEEKEILRQEAVTLRRELESKNRQLDLFATA